jgi:transcriptional regulator with XRE-family HTH domain
MPKLKKPRLFPAVRRRIRDLDTTQTELAEKLGMAKSTFSDRMSGRRSWTEPEMQMLLDEIGQPEETLADLFPRRRVTL